MQAAVVPILPQLSLKRILYATDFSTSSQACLEIVGALARHYQAEAYIANVRPPMPYTMATPEAVCIMENQRERAARHDMETLLHSPALHGVAASAIMETGDPAEELRRAVRDYDIDMVVVATHGRTGLMRLLMGSLAEELFRSLPCPVVTIGPHLSARRIELQAVRTILCPTDLSKASRAGFVNVAALARDFEAKVVVLHSLPGGDALSAQALESAVEARRNAQRMFAPDVDPRCPLEIVVDFGDPAERILAAAREHQADLIAFGVRQAGEATTHFRNTVAYKVVLEAECPVLTSRSAEKW